MLHFRASRETEEGVMKVYVLRAGLVSLALGVSLAAWDGHAQPAAGSTAPGGGAAVAQALKPLPGKEKEAPKLAKKTTVRFQTTAGEVVIEVYPEAAPNAAKRFVDLVQAKYYDDTPISRVVPGFVAQFGVNWRDPHKAWKTRNINDDPSYFQLERGTLAFAKASEPNSASTQVFINYADNSRLAEPRYNGFTAFGKVVSGMEFVDKFARVGDPSGGLDQDRLWNDGAAYLASLPAKPTMIVRATVE
jgi:cyclophilin family peptidyl-prolyl cis-trans isomerase